MGRAGEERYVVGRTEWRYVVGRTEWRYVVGRAAGGSGFVAMAGGTVERDGGHLDGAADMRILYWRVGFVLRLVSGCFLVLCGLRYLKKFSFKYTFLLIICR